MKFRNLLLGLAAAAALLATPVLAQTVSVPQVTKINPTDLFQDVVQGQPSAQSVYASALALSGYNNSTARPINALIGGNSDTNLYQRATTGSSVTTTITYGGPDRWAYWSGTSTAMTVSRDTTAADLPASSYASAFKMARTSGQTGVVQMCMAQEVETVNSTQFQGQTAELDFHATAGANFSAASGNIKAYIIYGTGSDEGVSKLAFQLNGGGGGSSTWTGQTNATAAVIPITTVSGRYAAVASIPVTATELAVVLCYTPVGTAGTNDYVAFSGIQLTRNASLASVASATVGYSCDSQITCTSFDRRLQGQEAALEYRYFYKLTETSAIAPVASCAAVDTTHTNCLIPMPVPMRIAPTATLANGFATPTSTTQATLGACSTLTAATTVSSTVGSTTSFLVNCAASTVPAAGIASFLYSNNGTGTISLSSEL